MSGRNRQQPIGRDVNQGFAARDTAAFLLRRGKSQDAGAAEARPLRCGARALAAAMSMLFAVGIPLDWPI